METDPECLIAADYCAEHGCEQAAKLLRFTAEDVEGETIDWREFISAINLCISWPTASTKLVSLYLRETVQIQYSTILNSKRIQVNVDRTRELRDIAQELLWRRRGGRERPDDRNSFFH